MAKDFLTVFPLYESAYKKDVRLFAIPDSNWNLYIDNEGVLYSVVKSELKEAGCGSTFFGDCNHVKRLINQGYFKAAFLTAFGRSMMAEKAGFLAN